MLCRGVAEGERKVQGGQQRTRRYVRRTHWILSVIVWWKSVWMYHHPFCYYSLQLLRRSCCHQCRRFTFLSILDSHTTKTTVGPSQFERHLAFVYILHSRVVFVCFILSLFWLKKIISCSILRLFLTSSRAFVRTLWSSLHFFVPQCCCTVYYRKNAQVGVYLRNCRFHIG